MKPGPLTLCASDGSDGLEESRRKGSIGDGVCTGRPDDWLSDLDRIGDTSPGLKVEARRTA